MNLNFASFTDAVKTFLGESGNVLVECACFAVAGPVQNNRVQLTNRDGWTIDGSVIAREVGIRSVQIVNDFVGIGYGILTLDDETDCVTIQQAPKVKTSPIACVGAGTGLGECFVTPHHTHCPILDREDGSTKCNAHDQVIYQCFPTEGGHVEYAPRTEVFVLLVS